MTRHVAGRFCAACLVTLALDEDEEAAGESMAARAPVHAYQVVSLLGREPGRMRYLARRQDFHGFVSLEIVSASALAGVLPAAIDARLAQLRSLRHPAIARVLEAWRQASGDWCLVSDYLAGRVPGAGVQLPSAADEQAPLLAIFDRVCQALAEAHARGVIHGRLGPESIVLVGRGADLEPRLAGFTLTAAPPTLADDIAGLGRILVALAAGQPFAAQAAALADRHFTSIGEIRSAAQRLLASDS